MDETRNVAPVIIKRKKVVAGGGHHGGAWKVAYADFVTAMMAFFMLMWLLNATTEKQRKGIADYFNPTIPVNRISGGGEGMFGGESVFSQDVLPQNGTGGSTRQASSQRQAKGNSGVELSDVPQASAEQKMLENLSGALNGNSGESSVADELLTHIFSRVTDEGLVVEIFDLPNDPLFTKNGTEPSMILRQLVHMISGIFNRTSNQIAINGFSRSYPIVLRLDPGWEKTTRQAHEVRKLMESEHVAKARIQRVEAWADRKPVAKDPMSERNNRLEIILLRSDVAATGK